MVRSVPAVASCASWKLSVPAPTTVRASLTPPTVTVTTSPLVVTVPPDEKARLARSTTFPACIVIAPVCAPGSSSTRAPVAARKSIACAVPLCRCNVPLPATAKEPEPVAPATTSVPWSAMISPSLTRVPVIEPLLSIVPSAALVVAPARLTPP